MPTAPFNSSTVLCDTSALAFYRTPPRYLSICPPLPHEKPRSKFPELHASPLATEILGFPLHVLTASPTNRSQTDTFRHHVMTTELPFGAVRDTLHGFKVASPAFTLFTLSRSISFNRLVMVAYEMCGRFTLFEPSSALDSELDARGLSNITDGWTRVRRTDGEATDQWMRPPIATISELKDFAAEVEGVRGAQLFTRAIDCVSGICASPFEAQLSMLFWMKPGLGGWGLRDFENNRFIRYSHEARVLTGKRGAEVDIRVLSPDGMREWILECQGRVVHDRMGAGTKDALRVTALQSMGYEATLITHDQIEDPEKFAVLRQMLTDKLGITWPRKGTRRIRAENDLRAEIFSDWRTVTGS